MNRRTFLSVFAWLLCVVGASAVYAADAATEAKGRMRDRVGAIDQLKLAETVGENNRGLLEIRKPDPAAASVVDAENRDRSTVFNETAKSAGSSPDAVGRAFAKQIAAASARGVWVQREDGTWQKK